MAGFTTIVLAGGASSRMSRPKALLPFGAETLIERVVRRLAAVSAEVVVVSGPHLALPPLPFGARIVEDEEPLQGPLSGIWNGLRRAAHDWSFVCGCDHPFLDPALAPFLVERGRASPGATAAWASWEGSLQPLVGAYAKAVVPVAASMLARGKRRVIDLPDEATVVSVPPAELLAVDPTGRSFTDIDTPEAYEQALAELASEAVRFRLFVYGTLKRGGRFHDRFCKGSVAIERASARGRLHTLPAGYPMLEVPATSVLAEGTADPLADAATQARIDAAALDAAERVTDHAWRDIGGELITFDDPAASLPPIDELEDFHPGAPSLYRRVLLPVRLEDGRSVAAWVYVGDAKP